MATVPAITARLGNAVELEAAGQVEAAYAGYLDCMTMLTAMLARVPAGGVKITLIPRLLRLAQQCLERVSELATPGGPFSRGASVPEAAPPPLPSPPPPPEYSLAEITDESLEAELEAFMAEGLPDVPGGDNTGAAAAAVATPAAQPQVTPLLPQVSTTRFEIFNGPDLHVQSGEAPAAPGPRLPPSPYLAYRAQVQEAHSRAEAKAAAATSHGRGRGDLAETRRLLEDAQMTQSRLDDIDARIKAAGTQTVVQLGPGEVTAQLALIANALYQRVTFHEMAELVKGATAAAPNVLSLALFMRYVRRWAISEVVTPKQPAERALVINHLVKILNFSVDARNFEVAMAILEALKTPAVARLQTTWSYVPRKTLQTLQTYEPMLVPTNRFENLRATMAKVLNIPPMQPYMGLFLEDLAFANANYDTGLGMLSEPGLKLYTLIADNVQTTQRSTYNYAPDLALQHYLLTRVQFSEVDSYELGRINEPPRKAERAVEDHVAGFVYDYYLSLWEDGGGDVAAAMDGEGQGDGGSDHGSGGGGDDDDAGSFIVVVQPVASPRTAATKPPQPAATAGAAAGSATKPVAATTPAAPTAAASSSGPAAGLAAGTATGPTAAAEDGDLPLELPAVPTELPLPASDRPATQDETSARLARMYAELQATGDILPDPAAGSHDEAAEIEALSRLLDAPHVPLTAPVARPRGGTGGGRRGGGGGGDIAA